MFCLMVPLTVQISGSTLIAFLCWNGGWNGENEDVATNVFTFWYSSIIVLQGFIHGKSTLGKKMVWLYYE